MAGQLLYLDSSAIMKLVVPEAESAALRLFLRSWPERVTSIVGRVEVERAAMRVGPAAARRATTVLARIGILELDEPVVRAAGSLGPPELRSLDAIHLATALALGSDLGAMCAYDVRLSDAASARKIRVLSPT